MLDKHYIEDLIRTALKEDMSMGDITTDNLIDPASCSKARLIAKADGVICGLDIAEKVFSMIDEEISFIKKIKDGYKVQKGDIIAEIEGNTRSLLKGERTALNLLQRLSGISTRTNLYCKEVEGLNVRIVDTRKTTPGLRMLEKYAVKTGGGHNHRFSLSDGVLIKDNHINASGGIKQAIEGVRNNIPHTIKIEIETETLDQVKEAVESGADIIMLDNMDIDTMKKAVDFINKRALVEASGNVNLSSVREIAQTGVDIISIGELTHSVMAFDISMRFV